VAGCFLFFIFRSSDFYLFIASLLGFCFDVSKMRVLEKRTKINCIHIMPS
jgi:hypothetical protein